MADFEAPENARDLIIHQAQAWLEADPPVAPLLARELIENPDLFLEYLPEMFPGQEGFENHGFRSWLEMADAAAIKIETIDSRAKIYDIALPRDPESIFKTAALVDSAPQLAMKDMAFFNDWATTTQSSSLALALLVAPSLVKSNVIDAFSQPVRPGESSQVDMEKAKSAIEKYFSNNPSEAIYGSIDAQDFKKIALDSKIKETAEKYLLAHPDSKIAALLQKDPTAVVRAGLETFGGNELQSNGFPTPSHGVWDDIHAHPAKLSPDRISNVLSWIDYACQNIEKTPLAESEAGEKAKKQFQIEPQTFAGMLDSFINVAYVSMKGIDKVAKTIQKKEPVLVHNGV